MNGAAEGEYFLIIVTPNSFLNYKISSNIEISMQIDEINLREIKVTYQGFYNNKKEVFIEVKKIFYSDVFSRIGKVVSLLLVMGVMITLVIYLNIRTQMRMGVIDKREKLRRRG